MKILDGSKFLNVDETFIYLNKELDLEYDITNLDALYDCLTMLSDDIEIINYKEIFTNMGEYGKSIIEVFIEAYLNDYINLNLLAFGGKDD